MAGSFGFEAEKYDVSIAIGELELLPAVHKEPSDSLIIADGFSCREQISQCTDRHALHLAEVIQMALRNEPPASENTYPEQARVQQQDREMRKSMKKSALALAGIAAGAALLWVFSRRS